MVNQKLKVVKHHELLRVSVSWLKVTTEVTRKSDKIKVTRTGNQFVSGVKNGLERIEVEASQ